jgi:tripartite-type tricarboxylate transporter receptor subunit TctC
MRLLFLVLAFVSVNSTAQTYPNHAVRMIVPFAPGGTTDGLGRVMSVYLAERLGQQVIVENRPGGGGTIGAEAAARSTPDGYTILLGSAEAYGMTDAMKKRLGYNPDKDLVPVTMMARSPNIFIVHPSLGVNTLAELIAFAKANPGKVRYGSPGIGSNPHLIGEVFASRLKLQLTHVPYKGGGAGIADVVSGQIEMLITGVVTAVSRVKAGQVKPLVVTGSARTPLLPEVPTMADAGIDNFVLGALFGILVPAGTPAEAIERLGRELPQVSANPEYRKRIIDIGQEITEPLAGEAFGRTIREEAARWRELANMAGVKDE